MRSDPLNRRPICLTTYQVNGPGHVHDKKSRERRLLDKLYWEMGLPTVTPQNCQNWSSGCHYHILNCVIFEILVLSQVCTPINCWVNKPHLGNGSEYNNFSQMEPRSMESSLFAEYFNCSQKDLAALLPDYRYMYSSPCLRFFTSVIIIVHVQFMIGMFLHKWHDIFMKSSCILRHISKFWHRIIPSSEEHCSFPRIH